MLRDRNISSEEDIKKNLFQVALTYLSYRDRFKKEIEIRLKKEVNKKYPKKFLSLIPTILTKLEKASLINDQDLIDIYIKSQHVSKLRGPYYIKRKLHQMGAPRELVESGVRKLITQESQADAIDKLIKKYQPNLKELKNFIKFQRLLIYRGFDINQIREKIAFSNQKE